MEVKQAMMGAAITLATPSQIKLITNESFQQFNYLKLFHRIKSKIL
jgi:hypothetical protein